MAQQSNNGNASKSAKDKIKDFLNERLKEAEALEKRKPALEKEADERISYAKTRLMKMEPFFAMLLFKMPTFASYDISTAATDGTMLLYNPVFIAETIMRKDLVFLLLHEISHVFWKHCERGPIKMINAEKIFKRHQQNKESGIKDAFMDLEVAEMQHKLKEWNFATDYTINYHNKVHVKIPISKELEKSLLFDKKLGDMTSEEVYEKIKTPFEPKDGNGDGNGDGEPIDLGIGGILPRGFGKLTPEEATQLEKEFEQDVQSAAIVAKRAGKLPGGIEEAIESLYQTQTPWQDILRTIFTSINKQDYTFNTPNKRYTSHMMDYGVIMPSLYGEQFIDCGFIMDTSGSVGKREKEILASELRNILEDYPIRLHVLYCDTKAYTDNIQIFSQEDIRNGRLTINAKGGGGTSMRPGFDYFRDNQDEFDFQTVICMTDMYLSDWGSLGPDPEFSVYWACLPNHDKKVVPDFGTKIEIVIGD